jgi:hypothetical protein
VKRGKEKNGNGERGVVSAEEYLGTIKIAGTGRTSLPARR